MTQVSRRTVAGSAALAGLGLPLLAACSSQEPGAAADPTPSGAAPTSDGASPAPGGSSADALASTSDIEVGGGTIFSEQSVVVTQPSEGEFKAFDTTCSHSGCAVSSVSDGTINCPCHGSMFSVADGSVQGGPAPTGLAEVAIAVDRPGLNDLGARSPGARNPESASPQTLASAIDTLEWGDHGRAGFVHKNDMLRFEPGQFASP
jgi:nitrite reductase/ring-hydroxylating ferredoxin subunit